MSVNTTKSTRERFTFAPPPPPDPLPSRCEYAERLFVICEGMLDRVRKSSTELAANQALLQLQRLYWMHYEDAPKAHKNHIGTRNTHTCLHQTYLWIYRELRTVLEKINPPPLREPSPETVKPVVREPALFIGDIEG